MMVESLNAPLKLDISEFYIEYCAIILDENGWWTEILYHLFVCTSWVHFMSWVTSWLQDVIFIACIHNVDVVIPFTMETQLHTAGSICVLHAMWHVLQASFMRWQCKNLALYFAFLLSLKKELWHWLYIHPQCGIIISLSGINFGYYKYIV